MRCKRLLQWIAERRGRTGRAHNGVAPLRRQRQNSTLRCGCAPQHRAPQHRAAAYRQPGCRHCHLRALLCIRREAPRDQLHGRPDIHTGRGGAGGQWTAAAALAAAGAVSRGEVKLCVCARARRTPQSTLRCCASTRVHNLATPALHSKARVPYSGGRLPAAHDAKVALGINHAGKHSKLQALSKQDRDQTGFCTVRRLAR